jgi:hypothetical protein
MTDFLDEKRKEITSRLKELKPLVEEYARLEAAAAALSRVERATVVPTAGSESEVVSSAPARPATRSGSGRPRGSRAKAKVGTKAKATTKRRAGRRKGSGTRAVEARSFIHGQPGITIPELAAKMGIKQNYLYRVLPGLEQERMVKRRGRGLFPADGWDPEGP